MKLITTLLLTAALVAWPLVLSAQSSPEQRTFDFQNLVALYAKRYAPYDWKRKAIGFDMLDIKPWLDRVGAARNDLEFLEIEAEYVADLQDTHSSFTNSSSFRAFLGFTVDIYDGAVLIDSISRAQLPAALYPFQIGDELVSVDGISSQDWIKRISTWRRYGSPTTTRRTAAQQITFRVQSQFPRAVDIAESATVEIRRASGALEQYTIRWSTSGLPLTKIGPVAFAGALLNSDAPVKTESTFLDTIEELHHYELPSTDLIRSYVNGVASAVPVFRSGFPSNFVQRLGRFVTDFHYSGTYVANGFTIGYLRFPTFSPASLSTTVNELRNEIDFLQKNTDALVVDVTRNPGGGCYMIDAAAALIPYPFYFFGEEIRATQDRLNSFQALLENAQALRADQATIDTYQSYVDQMKAALLANRGMTAPIAACRQAAQSTAPAMNGNAPSPLVYTKPMVVLIDEFSISAAEIFAAMIQDNKRAALVGMRSSGGGGSTSSWPTGFYSESYSSNTNTLVVRKNPIVTSEYPAASYLENIGARPDMTLDLMTRDNLVNGWRSYVDRFTQITIEEIRKAAGRTPFAIPNSGGVSLSTSGSSGQTASGYGRIEPNTGSMAPSGLAILDSRQNNVLVSETGIPATAAVTSGRIYVEITESVNTGIAIANPNNVQAIVEFYFTGPQGFVWRDTIVIPPNGQIAAFMDRPPFNNSIKPFVGALTFNSPVPVAVTAIRNFTNERGEFLLTMLPVTMISDAAASGSAVIPHFASGSGWKTQIALVNPTNSVLTGSLQFLDQSGSPATVTVEGQATATFSYSIPGGASQRIRISDAAQSIQVGSVHIVPAGNSAAPNGIALFSLQKNGITITETAAPAMTGGSRFRIYAEAAGNFGQSAVGSTQTGLAISNLSDKPATVTVELNRLDGSAMNLRGTLIVPANGQVSEFLNEIPGLTAIPSPFQGVVRISGFMPIGVTGLRARYNERRDLLITGTPPVNEQAPPADSELFFPQFAEAGGYSTQFILFSGWPGQTATGTLRLVSPSGNTLTLPLR